MGEHNYFASEVLRLLDEKNMNEIPLIIGGVIPPEDSRELLKQGVSAVFGPGSSLKEISAHIYGISQS